MSSSIHLIGHQQQRSWFQNAIRSGRLASTFLFVGAPGIGKRQFAYYLTQALFCRQHAIEDLNPCGECDACLQVAAGTHPDLLTVSMPEDKSIIPVELLVGTREARMQEGLCHDIRLRPMSADRRVAIIDDCDHLNQEGANALLKTLEEPPSRALIILIGTSAQRQLPTIRSRCQIIRFEQPSTSESLEILRAASSGEDTVDEQTLRVALEKASGELARARHWLHDEVRSFDDEISRQLEQQTPSAIQLASMITRFVEAAGTEAIARRGRMRMVSDIAAEYYRKQLRRIASEGSVDDPLAESALYRLQRCLAVREEVDRNANQATLIEAWANDLQRGQLLA